MDVVGPGSFLIASVVVQLPGQLLGQPDVPRFQAEDQEKVPEQGPDLHLTVGGLIGLRTDLAPMPATDLCGHGHEHQARVDHRQQLVLVPRGHFGDWPVALPDLEDRFDPPAQSVARLGGLGDGNDRNGWISRDPDKRSALQSG